ncbi:hypothetical protein [uncultured Devosia sp.]|uniref:capsular polysaccharide export protein, LipB/KpsS family n=1 Tax=uncultured Devosia sp. TaxID=211434 RepID=UPI00261E5E33|nr:hypothetical protein [uncultured Devosia sp.]
MRILFCAQSESLKVFESVRNELQQLGQCDAAGFIVSDRWAFAKYTRDNPGFASQGHSLLKEWEVTAKTAAPPDADWLASKEAQLGGDAGLFGALVADRRLWMGPDCTFTQDYRRRFGDDAMLSILAEGVRRVEALFDELRPEALVGFICVTFLDYLAYLVARSRKLAVLNLRPTRISDRVSFATRLNDPAPEFLEAMQDEIAMAPHREAARAHIQRVREVHGRYEGVVRASDKPALKLNRARRSPLAALRATIANHRDYRRTLSHSDNHVVNPTTMLLHSAVINPMRARLSRRSLAAAYFPETKLASTRYTFFPLHTEPEVSLLVYGRPYVNQIEVIRALAMCLPADQILLVKEHPWMVGKRSMDYYRSLLNIPRVRLVKPSLDARLLIQNAAMVAVITGSIALEAAIIGRPVLTFGDCPYNALPPTMVRRVTDPRNLVADAKDLLRSYGRDDAALERYVAASFANSESIQLYSTLLAKANVHTERSSDFEGEAKTLAHYLLRFYSQIAAPAATRSIDGVW